MPTDAALPVVHNTAAKRFEIGLDGRIVRTALDYARAQKLKVMPLCPFTAGLIHRHPEYQDLVVEGYRY
jgi:predicted GNAT family acetyltransferase